MIERSRTKTLLAEAERLAGDLGRFRTPSSGDPVDPSRVAELIRYLAMVQDVQQLATYLDLMPTSYMAKISQSALPQLKEIGRLVRPLIGRMRNAEEMLFVLGWTQRLLSTAERIGEATVMAKRESVANARRR
jgi:hypothetical protein